MKRHEAIKAVSHRTSDLEFINELYDNGYEIMAIGDSIPIDVNPKSKFMEEWEKLWTTFEPSGEVPTYIYVMIKLIDKHKADKEV